MKQCNSCLSQKENSFGIINKIWEIYHIIPQSNLPYQTMTDDNFQKCWALDNLNPLMYLKIDPMTQMSKA